MYKDIIHGFIIFMVVMFLLFITNKSSYWNGYEDGVKDTIEYFQLKEHHQQSERIRT